MDKKEFFRLLLLELKLPITANALEFLSTWANHEGGNAQFNPLNTTFKMPNSTPYNQNKGYPVLNYASMTDGIKATANTLRLKYYSNILQVLRAGTYLGVALQTKGIAPQLATWGTKNFAKKFIDGIAAVTPKKAEPAKGNPTGKIVVVILLCGLVYLLFNQYGNR